MAGTKRGPRQRVWAQSAAEDPSCEEWQEALRATGPEGGCTASIVSVGEGAAAAPRGFIQILDGARYEKWEHVEGDLPPEPPGLIDGRFRTCEERHAYWVRKQRRSVGLREPGEGEINLRSFWRTRGGSSCRFPECQKHHAGSLERRMSE